MTCNTEMWLEKLSGKLRGLVDPKFRNAPIHSKSTPAGFAIEDLDLKIYSMKPCTTTM